MQLKHSTENPGKCLMQLAGLLAAGSALAAKDWRVEARRRGDAKGRMSCKMDLMDPLELRENSII